MGGMEAVQGAEMTPIRIWSVSRSRSLASYCGEAGASGAARLLAGLRPRRQQVDELARLGGRNGPEQQLVEQREDRGVCPDSERQRPDGDQRHEGSLEERAKRVAHHSLDEPSG